MVCWHMARGRASRTVGMLSPSREMAVFLVLLVVCLPVRCSDLRLPARSLGLASVRISPDGTCGGDDTCVGSRWGRCCSEHGYCGGSVDYCGDGCQPDFGECDDDGGRPPSSPNSTTAAPGTAETAPPGWPEGPESTREVTRTISVAKTVVYTSIYTSIQLVELTSTSTRIATSTTTSTRVVFSTSTRTVDETSVRTVLSTAVVSRTLSPAPTSPAGTSLRILPATAQQCKPIPVHPSPTHL
jgi:hypothetical protein